MTKQRLEDGSTSWMSGACVANEAKVWLTNPPPRAGGAAFEVCGLHVSCPVEQCGIYVTAPFRPYPPRSSRPTVHGVASLTHDSEMTIVHFEFQLALDCGFEKLQNSSCEMTRKEARICVR